MRTTLLVICSLLSGATLPAADSDSTIIVRVDPQVELLSLVFRLAGAEEFNMPQSKSAYTEDAAGWFAPVREHAAVRMARDLAKQRDIGYDAVMLYAVHLTAELQPKIPFAAGAGSLDERWPPGEAQAFLGQLQAFRRESRFDDFLARHAEMFARAASLLQRQLAARPYRQWLDDYIGARPARFAVSIGMFNGSGNYGVAVRYPDGTEEIHSILGAAQWNEQGVPVFSDADSGLIVHEFCHSYTNPLVREFAAGLMPAGEKILPYRRSLLQAQAYQTAGPMLNETLVRMITTRFSQLHDSPETARLALEAERARGFLWIDGLLELLGRYEGQRDRYPRLASFMPEIVEFMRHTADNMEPLLARLPRVVSISPAPGASGVAAGDGEVRVVFDRPMRTTSRAVLGDFPRKRAEPYFEQEGRVFVYPVTFEPGKTYRFRLNSVYRTGFVSADGGWPMDPVEVSFETARL